MDKKILWIFPKSAVNVFVGALIVTYVLALIWSWVEAQSFSSDHYWVLIIEMLLLAVLIGGAVGMFAGNAKQSTLWTAAGFAVLGHVIAGGLMSNAPGGVDGATLASLGGTVFSTEVTAGALVLGIVAAATAAAVAKDKK